MQDLTLTVDDEELARPNLEDLRRLISKEAYAEMINTCLSLNAEVGHHYLAYDQRKTDKLVEAIRTKSIEFRCAKTNKLLISPVLAPDRKNYEDSILWNVSDLQIDRVLSNPGVKAEPFCKKSLKKLLPHLKLLKLSDKLLDLTAECLSVLEAEDEMVSRVLSELKDESMHRLAGKLGDFCSVEHIVNVIEKIEETLPCQALCLVRLLMQKQIGAKAFEEGFRCFISMLSKADLGDKALSLAEDVSENLSSSQLTWMITALGEQATGGDQRLLDRLKLRAALLKQRERADLNSGHIPDLDLKLITALEVLSRENFTLDEMLDALWSLFSTEFAARNSKAQLAINALNSDFKALREAFAQTKILTEQALAEQVAKHQESEAASKQTIRRLRAEVKSQSTRSRSLIEQAQIAQAAKCKELEQALLKSDAENESLNNLLRESQRTQQERQAALCQPPSTQADCPSFIYSCIQHSNTVYRTHLISGDQTSHSVASHYYQFKYGCCWTELPDGSLLITGGGSRKMDEVMLIDVQTWAVSEQSPMLSARKWHAAVYHAQHVYALGGEQEEACEKYSVPEMQWVSMAPLSAACWKSSAVVMEDCLYVLGGKGIEGDLDLVQRLHLEGQSWRIMNLKLPQPCFSMPCFKREDAVYLLVDKTFYDFTPLQFSMRMNVSRKIVSSSGLSYYIEGTLYCPSHTRAACSVEIGCIP